MRIKAVAGLVLFLAFEGLLFTRYQGHDARFHWFVHFFVGAAAALSVLAAVAIRWRRPPAHPLALVAALHLVAMFPDLLFAAGLAHRAWMNVFLGHVVVHRIPGRDFGWLAVFITALAGYLVALDRIKPRCGAGADPGDPSLPPATT